MCYIGYTIEEKRMMTQINPRVVVLMIFAVCAGWLWAEEYGAICSLCVVSFLSVLVSFYNDYKK